LVTVKVMSDKKIFFLFLFFLKNLEMLKNIKHKKLKKYFFLNLNPFNNMHCTSTHPKKIDFWKNKF
jgi:hypothetical protein